MKRKKSPAKQTRLDWGTLNQDSPAHTQSLPEMVYPLPMSRTNIDIDESLIRKARKLTRLKTKRQIVDKALELLVRSESRKGILRYYGSGVWKGDLKASRRNRV
jgi:Arc/MetJ family transcription regulator